MKKKMDKCIPGDHYAVRECPPRADTDQIKRKYLDIPYASISPAQKLDVYLPDEGNGPFPVIVSIHGGAFMGCDKGDMQITPMLQGLERGFAVVSINYRLSGEAKFPALVQDAKAAIRWIRGNAKRYSFNPDKIVAWGGSAGAYLASMLAVSAGERTLEDLSLGYSDYSSAIQASILWYSPTNFLKMDEQLAQSGLTPPVEMRHSSENSPESLLLGGKITDIPERVKAANPETYIKDTFPPMLLQHGRIDPVVPVQQSIEYYEKLKTRPDGTHVTLDILENAEHADPSFETAENLERIFRFLKENNLY